MCIMVNYVVFWEERLYWRYEDKAVNLIPSVRRVINISTMRKKLEYLTPKLKNVYNIYVMSIRGREKD